MIRFLIDARDLVFFSLAPLTRRFRWAFLIIFLLCIYPGIRLTFFVVPQKTQTTLINGIFLGSEKKMFTRSSQHLTHVRSGSGQVFKCSCSADGFSNTNCLNKNYGINEQAVKALTGKTVTLLLGPSPSLFGWGNLCYEISSEQKVWISYEKSAAQYTAQRSTFWIFFSWFFVAAISVFVLIRVFQFKREQ